MDGAHVGVLEESDQVGFGGFLEGHHGGALESSLDLDFVGNLFDKSLEGELSHQELGGSLVLPDFSDGHGSGFETVGLLDSAGGGGGLLGGGLLVVLLSGSLHSGG